ncbi:MAG TPA: adenylate/guanylate cyclase domain-containing protein [Microvirga sp.]|jgi:adenylate cyclase
MTVPASTRVQRRLAAILAADVVGFSALMGADEDGTIARIKSLRHQVVEPRVAEHCGRIFKTTGDGLLIEFPSPVEAVRCAMAILEALASNDAQDPLGGLLLRVGINLGDIVVEDDGDVYGEGVNIAARLEQLASPGSICISAKVYEEVRDKLPVRFEDLGEKQVKNIARPVRVYKVGARRAAVTAFPANPSGAAQGPSIAVLPFTNVSGDPEQEYFADGMVDEIITGLSRIHWLTVIARNSTFAFKGRAVDVRSVARELGVRYILEGSVRKGADRIRISTQLVEAEAGGHLWADRFEGSAADVFELQDQITEGVVGALEPTLRKAEIARAKRKRPDDLDAYDLYLRAVAHMYEVTPEGREAALGFVDRALALDPNYAEAHGVAAWCYLAKTLWEGGFSNDHREGALRHAQAVQSLQSEDATTLAHAAIALALATRDLEAALELIERALALNPNSIHAHSHGAVINTWAGHYDRAIALADRALRLSPFDPLNVMALAGKAGAHLMTGHYEASLSNARKGLQIYPTHTPCFLISIASLMRLSRVADARMLALQFIAIYPTYRILRRWPVLEHFCDELRAAGLPE